MHVTQVLLIYIYKQKNKNVRTNKQTKKNPSFLTPSLNSKAVSRGKSGRNQIPPNPQGGSENPKMRPGRGRHTTGALHKYPKKLLINRLINLEHVSIMDAHTWREWIQPITINHPQVNRRFVSADTLNVRSFCQRNIIYLEISGSIQTWNTC